jgi:hypothetical protein
MSLAIRWLLDNGCAQITDTPVDSVWTVDSEACLQDYLIDAYKKDDIGDYVSIDGEYVPTRDTFDTNAMLRVRVLHGAPPESLTKAMAPQLQRIVRDGVRLRARLPAYLVQRRNLLDAHCPLLPPLQELVYGYKEPTTTNELWATGLGKIL